MNQETNYEMLPLAREARSMSQSELAKRAHVSQGHMSKFERGELPVPKLKLMKIAEVLDFPLAFFWSRIIRRGFSNSIMYHRKRKSISRNLLRKIEARSNIMIMNVGRLLEGVDVSTRNEFSRMDIEDYNGDAVEIARCTRAQWGLPMGSIKNLIATIEAAGGVVCKCDFGTRKLDAISAWPEYMPPMFFVNREISADRMRFSLAHELGHVIMHHIPGIKMEEEADRFAAEFLMPADDIRGDLMPFTFQRACALKGQWRVSIASLIFRAFDLGVIDKKKYTRMFKDLSVSGYRTKEPIQISSESPRLIDQLMENYRSAHLYGTEDLCKLMRINESDFKEYYGSASNLRFVDTRLHYREMPKSG
ncbi:ImmA/IrrE family metallo-endopeptidase [Candidatus Pacearchaeota archaeon]|nr:ImmA/IrrE family metallo-endopeptidase [Candidatus Pacearchaeota archaeon]